MEITVIFSICFVPQSSETVNLQSDKSFLWTNFTELELNEFI